MKLTAAQAKERILSGNIEGDHEVMEDLDLSFQVIPVWPNWKFQAVNLSYAKITKITGTFKFLDCIGSMLEEIDPQLQVSKDKNGRSAYFTGCSNLEKVQGHFQGYTSWRDSRITEIDPRTKFGVDNEGNSADFSNCEQLTKAEGIFPGFSNWSGSGLKETSPQVRFGVSTSGNCACFEGCQQLLKVQGNFPGYTTWNK